MQKQQSEPKDAARWLAEKLRRDERHVPKGQIKGPIRHGPTSVVACRPCTNMFGYTRDDGGPAVIGVLARLAKRHAADHRLGRIKLVKE